MKKMKIQGVLFSLLFVYGMGFHDVSAQVTTNCTVDPNTNNINQVVGALSGPCKNEPAYSTNKVRKIDNRQESDLYGDALVNSLGTNNLGDTTKCPYVWACTAKNCDDEKNQKKLANPNSNDMGDWISVAASGNKNDAARPGLYDSMCFKYKDVSSRCKDFVRSLDNGTYHCMDYGNKAGQKDITTKDTNGKASNYQITPASKAVFDNLSLIISKNYSGKERDSLLKEMNDFQKDLLDSKNPRALVNYWHLQRLNAQLISEGEKMKKANPQLTDSQISRMRSESISNAFVHMLKTRSEDRGMVQSCSLDADQINRENVSAGNANDSNIKNISTSQLNSSQKALNKFFAKNGFEKDENLLAGFSLDQDQLEKEGVSIDEKPTNTTNRIPLYASGSVNLSYENGGKVCPEDKYLFLPKMQSGFVDNKYNELRPGVQEQIDAQVETIKQFVKEGNTIEKFRIKSSASTYRNTNEKYGDACPDILKYGQAYPEVLKHCQNGEKWPNATTSIEYDELSILRSLDMKKQLMDKLKKEDGSYIVNPDLIEIDWQGTNYIECPATVQQVQAHPLYSSWKANHKNKEPTCENLSKYNGTSGPLSPYEDKTTSATHDDYEEYKYVQFQIFGKGALPPRQESKVKTKYEAVATSMTCYESETHDYYKFKTHGGGGNNTKKSKSKNKVKSNSPVSCPAF